MQNIRKIRFTTKEGDEVYFNENGDPAAKYEIMNWQPNENGIVDFVRVGLYDASLPADKQLTLQNKSLVWAQNSQKVSFNVIIGFVNGNLFRLSTVKQLSPPLRYHVITVIANGSFLVFSF